MIIISIKYGGLRGVGLPHPGIRRRSQRRRYEEVPSRPLREGNKPGQAIIQASLSIGSSLKDRRCCHCALPVVIPPAVTLVELRERLPWLRQISGSGEGSQVRCHP